MLAAAHTDGLCILDQQTLRKPPSFFLSCSSLSLPPVASSWSPDNKNLFIASAKTIHKYCAESHSLVDVLSSEDPIACLAVKDKTSVIFGSADKVHILEIATAKISQTFAVHKNTVNSLSSSSDATLLASTSSDAAYVHNLTLSSHTPLRGLPVSGQLSISACVFHPHTRTRLLLGLGKQLVIYDITRPSVPIKVFSLNEATSSGNITAISCSPFSKTLVAVATAGGTLGLVDLEKEKGLFRTINVQVPIVSLCFSQEGGNIYLGTENGRLLLLDLRALDKPPKSIVLSESGTRITCLSVQSQTKSVSDGRSKPAISPKITRKPSVTVSSVTKPSPARCVVSTSATSKPLSKRAVKNSPSSRKDLPIKKVFSPLRNPLGVSYEGNASLNKDDNGNDDFSLQIDTLSGLRGVSSNSKSAEDNRKLTPAKKETGTSTGRVRDRTSTKVTAAAPSDPASVRPSIFSSSRLPPQSQSQSGPGSSPLSMPASRPRPNGAASKKEGSSLSDKRSRVRTVSTSSRVTARAGAPPSALASDEAEAKETKDKAASDRVQDLRRTRTVSSSSLLVPTSSTTNTTSSKSLGLSISATSALGPASTSASGRARAQGTGDSVSMNLKAETKLNLNSTLSTSSSASASARKSPSSSSGLTSGMPGKSGTGTGAGSKTGPATAMNKVAVPSTVTKRLDEGGSDSKYEDEYENEGEPEPELELEPESELELELDRLPETPSAASKRRRERAQEERGLSAAAGERRGMRSRTPSLVSSEDEDDNDDGFGEEEKKGEGEEKDRLRDRGLSGGSRAEVGKRTNLNGNMKTKGKGKGRAVLFQDFRDDSDEDDEEAQDGNKNVNKNNKENKRELAGTIRDESSLSLQISPRRPGGGSVGGPTTSTSTSAAGVGGGGNEWGNSPVRHTKSSYPYPYGSPGLNTGSGLGAGSGPGLGQGPSPQDLLRTIVRDILFDFHQETRAEVVGLHLDLVRMGRVWRRELRESVGGLGDELHELREENRMLREENERLRRGY